MNPFRFFKNTDNQTLFSRLFLIFSFLLLAISLFFFVMSFSRPYMGMRLYLTENGWEVATLDSNGQAIKEGEKAGDRPVEINEQPAATFLEKYRETSVVYGIVIQQLTVVGEDGKLSSAELKDRLPSRE